MNEHVDPGPHPESDLRAGTPTPPFQVLQVPYEIGRHLQAQIQNRVQENFPRQRLTCYFLAPGNIGTHSPPWMASAGGPANLNLCALHPHLPALPGAFFTEEPGSPRPGPGLILAPISLSTPLYHTVDVCFLVVPRTCHPAGRHLSLVKYFANDAVMTFQNEK